MQKLADKSQADAFQTHAPVDLHTFLIGDMHCVSIQHWGGRAAEIDNIKLLLLLLLKTFLSVARSLFAVLS